MYQSAEVSKVCIVALGSMVPAAMEAAALLENDGLASVRVVDPRWALPVPEALVGLVEGAELVLSVEDGLVDGGFGWSLRDLLSSNVSTRSIPVVTAGIPKEFLQQASRASIVTALGLDAQGLSERIRHALAGE